MRAEQAFATLRVQRRRDRFWERWQVWMLRVMGLEVDCSGLGMSSSWSRDLARSSMRRGPIAVISNFHIKSCILWGRSGSWEKEDEDESCLFLAGLVEFLRLRRTECVFG